MSPKALLRALVALGVLVVLWGAFALFRGSITDAPTTLALPRLTQADVELISSVHGADTLTLTRADGTWRVNGYRADPGQVDQVFRALTDSMATSELLARNASSHARLGVDSTGRTVVFSRGPDTLLALIVGTDGAAYQTAYLRKIGDNDVFLYRGTLPGLLARGVDTWRDRRIAHIVGDSVGTVAIARASGVTTVQRDSVGWTVGSRPADSAAVGRLLRGLADLTAIGFASPAQVDSLDFSRPDRRLTVLGRAGDTLLALAVDSVADGYWVRRVRGGDVFRLDFWRVNELMPPDSSLVGRTS